MNCRPRGCSPATSASTVPAKGTRAWQPGAGHVVQDPRSGGSEAAQGPLTISQGTRAVRDSFYMMKRARLLELSPDQRATFRRRVIDFNLPALDNSQAVLSPLSAERHQSSDHVSQFYFSRVN